ncbi:hypothetical protein EA472_21040 [Natrarchaeobius oligotrophus]|uniref:Uncharacterized protein n=1 Tax=Natrarchaeobius chitinivorans TaxID=1679083 RepID=A0A3N6P9T7_NATCH|nr:hypothetical protein EA472_21040 [Natrarchaeobius chitinivorans]
MFSLLVPGVLARVWRSSERVKALVRGASWRFLGSVAVFLAVVGLGSGVYPGGERGSSPGAVVVGWVAVFVPVAERVEFLAGRHEQ